MKRGDIRIRLALLGILTACGMTACHQSTKPAEAPVAKGPGKAASDEAVAGRRSSSADIEAPKPGGMRGAVGGMASAEATLEAEHEAPAAKGGPAIPTQPPRSVESAAPARPRILSIHLNESATARGQAAALESPLAPVVQGGLDLLPDNEGMALNWALPYMVSHGFLTAAQGERLGKVLGYEYGAMAKVPEFATLESTLKISAQSLFTQKPVVQPDHSFVLLPDRMDPDRAYPVMLFLHGQGMNFHAYSWAFWKNVGHNDWIILLPTIDGWRVRGAEWTAYYTQLIEWTRSMYKTDGGPVTVVGHSAGTFDAMRLALHHPKLVGNLVLLAGHWTKGLSDQFDALWPSLAKHNILVHCAEKDTLVPLHACKELHRQITVRGNAARFAVGPDMDHFSMLEGDNGPHRFLFQWAGTR